MTKDISDHPSDLGERGTIISSLIPEIICPPDCDLCCQLRCILDWNRQTGVCVRIITEEIEDPPACPRLQNDKCSKFQDRNFACQLFFKSEDHPPCPKGRRPATPLTIEEFRRVVWCIEEGTMLDTLALRSILRRGSSNA